MVSLYAYNVAKICLDIEAAFRTFCTYIENSDKIYHKCNKSVSVVDSDLFWIANYF